jgi:hypothetical protein
MSKSQTRLRGSAVVILIGAIALWALRSRDATAPQFKTAAPIALTLAARGETAAPVQQTAVNLPSATKDEANRSADPKKEKLSLVKRMENGKMLSPDPAKLAAYLHENGSAGPFAQARAG